MRLLRNLCITVVVLAMVVGALFLAFTINTFATTRTVKPVDAIVVLAGGKGRIQEGVRLYRQGVAPQLFLIGVDPSVRRDELYRQKGNDPGADGVILEQQSRNTLENAFYGRTLLTQRKTRSILLITSRYHLRRAELLFKKALPADVVIHAYPVDSANFKNEWWNHIGSTRLLWGEFYKYWLLKVYFVVSDNELKPSLAW